MGLFTATLMPYETVLEVYAMRLLVLAATVFLASCGVEDEPTTSVTIGGVDSSEWWPEEYPPRSDDVKRVVFEVASKIDLLVERSESLLQDKVDIYEKDSALFHREIYCPLVFSYFNYRATERFFGLITFPEAMAKCSAFEEFVPQCEAATSVLFEVSPVTTRHSPSPAMTGVARDSAEEFANAVYKKCLEDTQ